MVEALRPFANAYRRLRHYGDNPTDETPLYAYAGEGHPLYELLNGEHGERLTVQTLGEAAAALEAALSAEPAEQGEAVAWCEPDVIEHMSPMAGMDGVDAIKCVLLREKSERHTVPLYTAPPAQPAQHGSGAARYINTGSPRWDSAAFKAWQEGNRPGSHNWMKRMRELLATRRSRDGREDAD